MGASLVSSQASVQRYVRPATWVTYCKSFHDAKMQWHFETKIKKKKENVGEGLIAKSGAKIRSARSGPGSRRVSKGSRGKKSSTKLTARERFCESIISFLKKHVGKDKELPEGTEISRSGNVVTVSLLTGSASWLNVVDFTVEKNPSIQQGGYIVKAKASSTGILPMYVPLAPVFNVALFWTPFPDNGSNEQNISQLEKILMEERDQWHARRIDLA
mmetsp:Transcript_24159/g.38959  ORF Transcript_24159/g.38959 Transcript_24159/m.38959 type:complete len:216 (-) Transcript_24159:324-971(-)